MTDRCRVECLDVEKLASHVAAWADLDGRCLEPSAFNAPAFALAAARLVPGPRPRGLLVWDRTSGSLIGLCLIARVLPGWPVRAWLHKQAVAAFPLLDRGEAHQALGAMLGWAAGRFSPGLLLQGLSADGETARLIEASVWTAVTLDERRRAVLPGGRTSTGLAGKAGKEVRRQARRLGEHGTVAVRSFRARDAVAAELENFLRLEAAGWKGRRGTALARSAGLSAFARSIAADMAEQGACRIDRLDLDGRPIAMGIVLRSGPTAFYWKTAFDEAYARFSPGVQITMAISQVQAKEPELALTDSCAVPDHAMIDRLWPDRATIKDVLVGSARPSLVSAFARVEQSRRSLRQRGKNWVLRLARLRGS